MVTTSPGFRSLQKSNLPQLIKLLPHHYFTRSLSFRILSYFYFYTDVFIQKIGAVDRKPEYFPHILFSRDRGRKLFHFLVVS
ncbi:hypothetical protein L1987_72419 [Smallanthus sonchifolius]|uniref:Uncharacterized protein n=1 Tax=Smallanthus sonchifolius TaxID=185202 RepID=A0ACB9AVJ5_9ASTR|nr:hypothetical protein L1987_72419 [Smallanthus sonchifolius]